MRKERRISNANMEFVFMFNLLCILPFGFVCCMFVCVFVEVWWEGIDYWTLETESEEERSGRGRAIARRSEIYEGGAIGRGAIERRYDCNDEPSC